MPVITTLGLSQVDKERGINYIVKSTSFDCWMRPIQRFMFFADNFSFGPAGKMAQSVAVCGVTK